MAKGYVIFNPIAGNGKCEEDAKLLQMLLKEELEYFDMTRITNYSAFIHGMGNDDYLIIVGGDGTLNRFVNDTAGLQVEQEILYFSLGTGNDFVHDLGRAALSAPVSVTQDLKELPSVEVKGKTYRFINGVGSGKLRTLSIFPSIFKGEHVKQTDVVAVHTGHEITVEFDRPTPLQIDGETILDVTSYTARSTIPKRDHPGNHPSLSSNKVS